MDLLSRNVRLAPAYLLAASLAIGGCGSDQTPEEEQTRGIAPESFVNCAAFQRANERREQEDQALEQARDMFTSNPCAVRGLDVPEVQNARFVDAFDVLLRSSEQACEAGITGLQTSRDAEGRLTVESPDGGFVQSEAATFIFGEDAAEVLIPWEEVVQTRGLIDGFNGVPAHRAYFGDDGGAVITASPGTELLIRRDGAEPTRVGGEGEDQSARIIRGDSGDELEIFARSTQNDSSADQRAYQFSISTRVEDLTSIMPSWRPGESIRESYVLDGSLRSASVFGPDCYGSVSQDPTTELLVQSRGWAAIGAESSEDTTIAVISPEGVAYCNDDWNGLNPLVELELTEGVWQIYVGAWSDNLNFPFELTIAPR